MKRTCTLLFVFLIANMLSSCNGNRPKDKPPIGLWKSDEPYIVIDIKSQERGNHYGIYNNGIEDIEIYILFAGYTNDFFIRDNIKYEKYNKEENLIERDKYEYFCGKFTVRDDKMYYTLKSKWEEMHRIKEIVFTKVADVQE